MAIPAYCVVKKTVGAALAAVVILACTKAGAENLVFFDNEVEHVDDTVLNSLRGGFDVGNGMLVSFGIDRVAYVNGALVASTSFNLDQLVATVGKGSAATLAPQQFQHLLIQNGAGNLAKVVTNNQLSSTIIQNSLNNQTLSTVTTINAAVNTLNTLRSLNLNSTLTDSLGAASISR